MPFDFIKMKPSSTILPTVIKPAFLNNILLNLKWVLKFRNMNIFRIINVDLLLEKSNFIPLLS